MPLADLPRIAQGADLAQINDYLIMLGRRLNDFLNHLDTLNVDELDANVIIANTITASKIVAGTITANEIAANAITATKILAGAVTAAKIAVTQLSAISADLGNVTAGSITSNTTVNVGTSATIGDQLFLSATNVGNGISWGNGLGMEIFIDNIAQTIKIIAPGGVYANSKRIDI